MSPTPTDLILDKEFKCLPVPTTYSPSCRPTDSSHPSRRRPRQLLVGLCFLAALIPFRSLPTLLYDRWDGSFQLGSLVERCSSYRQHQDQHQPQMLLLEQLERDSREHRHRAAENGTLEQWIEEERMVAWNGMLANIGPVAGALPGLVIASPSTSSPDYYYTWTRDSAITFLSILDRFLPSASPQPKSASVPASAAAAALRPRPAAGLESLVREYVAAQAALQVVDNRSGGFTSGGLGEPKFEVDGTAFKGNWGRPQNDGPPLRALVLIRYANYLLDRSARNDLAYVHKHIYNPHTIVQRGGSVLKNDLEFVAHRWHMESFDLWEEISASHFFTLLISQAALMQGSILAQRLNDSGAASFYAQQAFHIADKLETFWINADGKHAGADGGYITATLDAHKRFGRTGLDSAVLLAVIKAGGDQGDWSVGGDRVLATVERYLESFRGLYKINGKSQEEWKGAVAVGRYAEDIYDGVSTSRANPWFICTFTVAELYYRILAHHLTQQAIVPTPTSLSFWRSIQTNITLGSTYIAKSTLTSPPNASENDQGVSYNSIMQALERQADGFLEIGKQFQGPGGSLTEQFDRDNGRPTGARNLTWSYGAFLDAIHARDAFQLQQRRFHHDHIAEGHPASTSTRNPFTLKFWRPIESVVENLVSKIGAGYAHVMTTCFTRV